MIEENKKYECVSGAYSEPFHRWNGGNMKKTPAGWRRWAANKGPRGFVPVLFLRHDGRLRLNWAAQPE